MKKLTKEPNVYNVLLALCKVCIVFGLLFLFSSEAAASYTVTPITWNIVGLDSNRPADGPNHFPVGARVCSTSAVTNVDVDFVWDSANANIDLRSGSLSTVTIPSISAGGCADAYFEVEVNKVPAAFDTTRRYHITAGGVSTTVPREIYVEHIISQSRNGITNVELNGTSVPAGGSMNLIVGNTYTIRLTGFTAPAGYNQFEAFINFPNTIFQVISVNTTYSADDGPYVTSPSDKLYADACLWDNDPNSPTYRDCIGGDYKAGGSTVVTTYTIKILSGGGTTQTLTSLLYDFSGSSFHYNADFSTGARIANVIDPASVTISKNFSPDPTNVNGVSALTFTINNPNAGALSGLNFTDVFPTTPGQMKVANPTGATTNGCGTPTFSPVADAVSISFASGTIAAYGNCTVKVNVTVPATGTYTNTSSNLFVGSIDTGDNATDTLVVNTEPPAPTPVCNLPIAQWTFPAGFSTTSPSPFSGSGTASPGAGILSTDFAAGTDSWGSNGAVATGATLTTSNNDFVQFSINTTDYSTIYLTFDAARKNNANSPTGTAVYYASGTANNPEPNAALYSSATALPTGTTAFTSFGGGGSLSFTPTAATMYVRIYFFNSGNANAGSDEMVDNVTFTGCKVPNPPTMTKAFSPNPVAVGATSTLTFTVVNPNSNVTLNGVAFSDILPAGLTVANSTTSQCGGTNNVVTNAGTNTITVTGGTLAGGASCNITATVTATTAGPHDNISGFVTSTETGSTNAGSAGIATASLTALSPPGITKRFAPNPVIGGISTLTFTITNPNQNNSLSGVAFSDTFPTSPGAMTVSNPTGASYVGCGSPTYSPVIGADSVSFSGGTILAGSTCTATVKVTAITVGDYVNTSGNVSHIINAATVNGNTATDTVTLESPLPGIALLKQVGPSATGPWSSFLSVAVDANVYYKFTVENIGDVALTSVNVTDALVSTASCSWPSPLPAPVSGNENHIATCVTGAVTALTGVHPNTATAHGTYSSTEYHSVPSTASYATPGITFDKTSTDINFTGVGYVLDYNFLVTNNGSVPLLGPVTVADNKATDESCPNVNTVGDFDNYLDPGESITCTATYTVIAGDVTAKLVTNTASATVGGITSSPDSLTVPLAPDLTVTKANNVSGIAAMGSTFDWTLTVTNEASAGSAFFLDTNTILTDNLPTTDPTFVVGTVTKTGGTTGAIICSISSDTLTCTADGAVTIPPGGSFSVPVTVTPDAVGFLTNPNGGGTCKVDPGAGVIPETNESNNNCNSDTVEVKNIPNITITKSSSAYYDPINEYTNPKSIPGGVIIYTIETTNSGSGAVDIDTTVITDPIPANTTLYVDNYGGANECGPVEFIDGATTSGLTCNFNDLSDLTDDVNFSDDAGPVYTYDYVPVPAGGYDSLVTSISINPKGTFNAAGAGDPSFKARFKVKVK